MSTQVESYPGPHHWQLLVKSAKDAKVDFRELKRELIQRGVKFGASDEPAYGPKDGFTFEKYADVLDFIERLGKFDKQMQGAEVEPEAERLTLSDHPVDAAIELIKAADPEVEIDEKAVEQAREICDAPVPEALTMTYLTLCARAEASLGMSKAQCDEAITEMRLAAGLPDSGDLTPALVNGFRHKIEKLEKAAEERADEILKGVSEGKHPQVEPERTDNPPFSRPLHSAGGLIVNEDGEVDLHGVLRRFGWTEWPHLEPDATKEEIEAFRQKCDEIGWFVVSSRLEAQAHRNTAEAKARDLEDRADYYESIAKAMGRQLGERTLPRIASGERKGQLREKNIKLDRVTIQFEKTGGQDVDKKTLREELERIKVSDPDLFNALPVIEEEVSYTELQYDANLIISTARALGHEFEAVTETDVQELGELKFVMTKPPAPRKPRGKKGAQPEGETDA